MSVTGRASSMPLIAAVAALVAGVSGCQSAPQHGANRTVRLVIHQDPIAFLPVRVAQTLGYFAEERLTVDVSEAVGGTKAIQALLGGSVDVAAASVSDAIQLAGEGHQVREFLLFFTRPTVVLAVAPSMSGTIHSIRDLKGRAIGVTSPGSSSHQILNHLLRTNGISPDDVSTVSVGMGASSVAALERGSVAAAILLASAIPVYQQRQPRAVFLADLRTTEGANEVFGSELFPGLGLVAEDRWLRADPETARRLTRAVVRGMQWVREQPAERVRDMIPEELRMTPDTELLAIRQVQNVLSADGRIPEQTLPLVAKFVAAANPKLASAHVDITRLYTNEFISSR